MICAFGVRVGCLFSLKIFKRGYMKEKVWDWLENEDADVQQFSEALCRNCWRR